MSPEAWSAVANCFTALAAIVAAGTAVVGLRSWKNQNVWQSDNELAKQALMVLYKFRDSLFSIRHPAMFNAELEIQQGDVERLKAKNENSAGVIKAYVKRWEKHIPAQNELNSLLLETKAVWGPELENLVASLREFERELLVHIHLYFDAYHRSNPNLAKDCAQIYKKRRDILYDTMSEESDEFRKDCAEALVPIENYLRTKLGRGG